MLSGMCTFFFYLLEVESNVPFFVLAIAVFVMAVGTVLSFAGLRDDSRRNVAYFLLTISILYFSISMISTIRYETFSGLGSPDNLGEYFVAQVTDLKKVWASGYDLLAWRPSWYFSCLSVTILPTILAELTGLDLSNVFAIVYPIIFSIIPTLIFLVVKEVYSKTKMAALSTILFCEMFRFSAPQMGRQYVAIIFLLLTLLVVFRHRVASMGKQYFVLFFFFVLGVVLSHYLVTYFMIAVLIAMLIAPHLRIGPETPKRLLPFLNKHSIVLVFVVSILWMVLSNLAFFGDNILMVRNSFFALLGMIPAQWPSQVRAPGRTAGEFVTFWYAFQTVLIIVGFCLILLEKRKKNQRIFTWTIAGGLLFAVLFLSFVIPTFSKFLGYNRVYSIALPIWISFLAYALLRTKRRIGSVLLVIFLLVNLPINLTLPSYNNVVIFSPERSVDPALAYLQTYNDKSEVATFEWAQSWLQPNQTVTVDARGSNIIQLIYNLVPKVMSSPEFGSNSSFLVLNHYNLEYGLWASSEDVFVTADMQALINNSNVVYNNQQSVLLEKPPMP